MTNLFSSDLFGGFSSSNTKPNTKLNFPNTSSASDNKNLTSTLQTTLTIQESYSLTDDNIPYRNSMEDFVTKQDNFIENYSLYCVFDGHGGKDTAEYVNNRFADILKQKLKENDDYTVALNNTFKSINNEIKFYCADTSGTTAAIALLSGNKILTANVGDSSIALIDSKQKEIKFLTEEHKLSNEREMVRVLAEKRKIYNERVGGSLIITRSIGDHCFNKYGLSNDPFIHVEICTNKENKILVIASDGIWDIINKENLLTFDYSQSAKEICYSMTQYAKNKGSRDNISIIIVKL